jgi:transcriptional regulator with XRE-family HTH domain
MKATQRRQLTQDETDDIDRLRTLFEQRKEASGLTQTQLAEACGWESQGTVAQYFSKRMPLNLEAAFRFSKALGVPLDAISPRLAAKAVELFGATIAGQERPKTFEDLLTHFAPEIERLRLTETGRKAIAGLVKAYEDDPAAGDRLSKALLTLVGGE